MRDEFDPIRAKSRLKLADLTGVNAWGAKSRGCPFRELNVARSHEPFNHERWYACNAWEMAERS